MQFNIHFLKIFYNPYFISHFFFFLIATRDYRIAIRKCHMYETIPRYGTREL